MNAGVFLEHLEAEGVRITRNGDELRIQTRSGASSDAYIDLIRLNRAGLLATLAGERHDIPWITPVDLHWVHVDQREVDETVPPADWDGVLPADCAWSLLCEVLGPCSHVVDKACRCQQRPCLRAATDRADARKALIA